jgi:hypothetical protein
MAPLSDHCVTIAPEISDLKRTLAYCEPRADDGERLP